MGRLVEQWFIEGLYSIGRFFLHPFTYFLLLFSFILGYYRVKKERKSFHIRVYDTFEDIRYTYSKGIGIGLIISFVTLLLGLSLPFGTIVLWTILTFILCLTFQPRWLSPVFTVGGTIFLTAALLKWGEESEPIYQFFVDIDQTNFQLLSLLLVLMLLVEGILIYKTASIRTSPSIIKSSRGLPIGNHTANRTWLVPLMLLVPGGNLSSPVSWWPVLSIGDQTFLLMFIPFVIGFHQRVQGSLPKESIQTTGKRVIWLSVICLIPAIIAIWVPIFSFIVAFIALVGREFMTVKQRMNDDSASFYFSKRDQGLVVLGTLPSSPGEKMSLQVGEIILKTNGQPVKSEDEFYKALQKNRAYCKLEVLGLNGEIRYAQGALYEGSHHELGILFVQDYNRWEQERASIS